jgi:hypothetical protein
MSADVIERAWVHQCGTINLGAWTAESYCGGCRYQTRRNECQQYWLFLDSGAADVAAPATPLLEPGGTVYEVTDAEGNDHYRDDSGISRRETDDDG